MAQTAIRFSDQRASPRYKLVSKQLPGNLHLAESGRIVFAIAVDASRHGLGVAIAEQLNPGTCLILVIAGSSIPLRVVWSKRSKQKLYRHGLEVTDKSLDIEDQLFATGCLEVDLDNLP